VEIRIVPTEIRNGRCRLSFQAPPELVRIEREEIRTPEEEQPHA
jgi:sRNA-binding carbon storage regulator CsrA